MALIKCPECGHEISEYADKCISCGCPMSKIKELMSTRIVKSSFSLSSNSSTFQKLDIEEKSLVNELCEFISSHTSLILIDHSKHFGFRKQGTIKMVIVFRYSNSGKTLYIVFKTKTEFPSNKVRVKQSNISKIKDAILKYYSGQASVNSPKKIVVEDEEPVKKEKPESFTSTRKDYENYLIKTFEEKLKLRIDGLIIKNNPYMYTFRISKGDDLFTLCWFSNGDNNKLAFKYYLRPLDREPQKVLYPVTKDVETLVDMIYKIYSGLPIAKPFRIIEDEPVEPVKVKGNSSEEIPIIYNLIIKAINDKPMNGSDDMTRVCNEVKSFVYSEIMRKGIEEKYFKNEEEFNRYKYSYRFVPNFFGYTFSLKSVKEKDAKCFYSFYKAIKLIGIIKQYERIYNKTIVHDYLAVLQDYQKMLIEGDISYSMSKGLTSSFSLVPTEALDDCLEKLNALEGIY